MAKANQVPPPASLALQIERARAELAEREAERKAAWSVEGRSPFSQYQQCGVYHVHFQLWQQAADNLRALERRGRELADAR